MDVIVCPEASGVFSGELSDGNSTSWVLLRVLSSEILDDETPKSLAEGGLPRLSVFWLFIRSDSLAEAVRSLKCSMAED